MLALQGIRALDHEGRKITGMVKGTEHGSGIVHVWFGRLFMRSPGHSRAAQAMPKRKWSSSTAGRAVVARSVREAQRLIARARAWLAAMVPRPGSQQRGSSRSSPRAPEGHRAIDRRARGLTITDRLVFFADPDARPIRKGKSAADRVWVSRADLRGDREHPKRRSSVHPAHRARAGQPRREPTVANRPRARTCRYPAREIVCDDRFQAAPTKGASPTSPNGRSSSPATPSPDHAEDASAEPLQTGIEERMSHLERRTGYANQAEDDDGIRTWTGWAILASASTPSPSGPAETLTPALNQTNP